MLIKLFSFVILLKTAEGQTTSAADIVNRVLNSLQTGQNLNSAATKLVLEQLNPLLQQTLGKNVKAEEYKPASDCKKCPEDCDMSKPCCWFNTQDDGAPFIEIYKATGKPDPTKWLGIMFNDQLPDSPYALTADRDKHEMWFVSSPIDEQPADATLELKEWASPLIKYQACTRKPNTKKLENCVDGEGTSPGPVKYKWNKTIKGPLEVVIKVSGFGIIKPGGIAIFDDIKYKSSYCDKNKDAKSTKTDNKSTKTDANNGATQQSSKSVTEVLRGDVKAQKMVTAGRPDKVVRVSKDLGCQSFDSRCRWRSESTSSSSNSRTSGRGRSRSSTTSGDDLEYQLITGNPDSSQIRAYSETSVPPSSPYAMVFSGKARSPGDGAYWVSDQIKCQRGRGELRMRYWTTRNSNVKVCTRRPGGISPIQCSKNLVGNPGPAFVSIPSSSSPFEIYVLSDRFTSSDDYVIIDDITYTARMC